MEDPDFTVLDDDNFLYFAAKSYYRPRCNDVNDFYDDINRIKYVKRLLNKFRDKGKLSERLLLNHIIIIGNSFTIPSTLRILEFKIDEKSWPALKAFLVHLRYIREEDYPHIEMDKSVAKILGEI